MEQEVQLGRLCTRLINAAFILPRWGKMEAVQKDYWYFVVLLFLPFLKVAVQQTDVEIVRLEEGMTLHCLCPWDGQLSMVSWTKLPDKNPIAVFHPEFGVSFSYPYRERIEFLKTTTMDGSISMKNVTHQDIGLYHCSVQTFPQGPWTRNIQVEDLDEPPEDNNSTEPSSLEDIMVDTELVAEQSNNLTISCKHPHNGTIDQVILEKMLDGHPWVIIGICKKVEGGLVGEDYSDRGRVNCADSLDLSLHLTDVSPEDSGFYRCTFNTDVGVQTTVVQLKVAPPGGVSLSLYMMYIYIGAGAAGFVLLTSFLILAMRLRKKTQREQYRVKLHPTQRQPNIYENVPLCPSIVKKSRKTKSIPIYANLPARRSLQTTHQLQDKKRKGML
ncbi:CD226 antigen isoform X1 [Girardinichthys multiradiatus]|uniref:CD226 antigen isoform X1 n=1 Tax=Girardinichthys multiradiatus TaxID=208333 RepID=UPI001FADE238|nr:CD226 antigen isoform X1 [Girardinichthys multiradiatus]